MYASTLDLPVWRYYDERIVNFDLFGNKMWGKQGGVNRDVLPTLRLVEQEATRMAGVQTVAALKFAAAEWGGFRFEPQKADLANKRHVSYHATGLAIDFRVQTNNVITGPATELLDAIATQGGVRSPRARSPRRTRRPRRPRPTGRTRSRPTSGAATSCRRRSRP